ncbi:thermonuclease family protein [Corynebacterium sp. AOP40-9SA-29]|uniref:thermonuclease family protein n=1 Tax=Corynebacterium sp. AOP40-9SA-29 TaxID=3457677 RepID=UPI0040344504
MMNRRSDRLDEDQEKIMTRISRTVAAATAAGILALGLAACSELDGAIDEVGAAPAVASEPQSLCEIGSCEDFTVDRVIDGDTVDVATDGGTVKRVRVLGIDTPETVHPDKPVECMGPEASAIASELAPAGVRVTLVTDEAADDVDDYDRQLAHVVVGETNLGAEMLARGLAHTTSFPHSLKDHYTGLQDAAEHNHLGLWGHC